MPGVKQQYQADLMGGPDFMKVDRGSASNPLPFLPGTVAFDSQGQRYIYCKFTAQLASADVDSAAFWVTLTKTLPTIAANHDIAAADLNDGKDASYINGCISDCVAALSASSDQVDGAFERKVVGATANQFTWTPTSTDYAGAWVKTSGIVRKAPAPAGALAGKLISRVMSGGALVMYSLDGNAAASLAGILGRWLEAVDAGGQADAVIDVSF